MQDFRKLDVWHKSYNLAFEIHKVTQSFPKEEVYGLVNQMRRASVSIPANIAEGCGRYTATELVRFLDIAMGSISEVDCYLQFARDLEYVTQETYAAQNNQLVEVRRMLIALIQRVRSPQRSDK